MLFTNFLCAIVVSNVTYISLNWKVLLKFYSYNFYCWDIQQTLTSKLHKTAWSVGFIKKVLYHHATPNFSKIAGDFIKKPDRTDAE